jgi:alginate O-acetyltransferase complex protein AlgI
MIFLCIFFPIALIGYYLLKPVYRNTFLLLISLLFYAWGEPRFVFVMLAVVFIDYICGRAIHYAAPRLPLGGRRALLFVTVILNLAPLMYFKYFNFFLINLDRLPGIHFSLEGVRDIVLPIGISFFTFQAMSYVLDLYFGKVQVQKNPLKLLLYIALFPQLIAGPIVRYADVAAQIDNRTCTLEKFSDGARRFVIGLGKKAIIANAVALTVDDIFALPPHEHSMATAWVGIVCYTVQIYFDFSGYSDMAIGLGKLFGFDFLENFNYPYVSRSLTEFWRRWHISMSTWFRDYVYIPLGGNRRGNVYVNLFVVFFLTGLWHGASWGFVVWGLWHGLFLIAERRLRKKEVFINVPSALKWLYMMVVVVIGWVVFRAPDLSYALEYIGVLFGLVKPQNVGFTVFWYLNRKLAFYIAVAILAAIPWKRVFPDKAARLGGSLVAFAADKVIILALFVAGIASVMTSTYNPFIYFRF